MTPTKPQLRAEMRRRLAEPSDAQRADWSDRISRRLVALPAFAEAGVVMAFLSLPGEVETRAIIEAAWAAGKRVVVPQVDWDRQHMSAVELASWAEPARVGRFGLTELVSGRPVDAALIELVLAPGLAFDAAGWRLGRGGGFFDRFLAQPDLRAVSCGLAFEFQRVETLPCERCDRRVDLLVTEAGTYAFTAPGRRAAGLPPSAAGGDLFQRFDPSGR